MPDLQPLPDIQVGKYRHYKGGEYYLLTVARHSETLEPMVIYYSPQHSATWVRPASMWFDRIDGVQRFTLIED